MFHLYEKINRGEVYVIAEMSANHGGSLENALEIVRGAAKAGADCLKIQTYTADSLTIDCGNEYFKIKGGLWDGYKLYDLYKEAGTPYEWQKRIKEECDACGIDFLSTPFDAEAVDFLEEIGSEAYKIASFEMVDIPLIEYAAAKKMPMIISCGMGNPEEIQDALDACRRMGNEKVVLLKCCSEYPANWEDMHLGNIPDMRERFGVPVGLSDHSVGSLGAVTGVALGACVVEKHVKLDGVESADSKFSMTMQEFAQMVKDVRAAEKIRRGPVYELTEGERASTVFRRSIFAVKDIRAGEPFTEENIRVIRPGYGIAPKYFKELTGGMICRRDIKRGEPLCMKDLEKGQSVLDFDSSKYILRRAKQEDMDLLFRWANDPVVRNNSFHTESIAYEEHRKWFSTLMQDKNQVQYIFMADDEPVGQIRFAIDKDKAEIGYSIASEMRGKGLGKILMELAKKELHQDYPMVKTLVGAVKQGNVASENCFMECGFREIFKQFELEIEA